MTELSDRPRRDHWPFPKAVWNGPLPSMECQTCGQPLEPEDDAPHGWRHAAPAEPKRTADGTSERLLAFQSDDR